MAQSPACKLNTKKKLADKTLDTAAPWRVSRHMCPWQCLKLSLPKKKSSSQTLACAAYYFYQEKKWTTAVHSTSF